MEKYEKTDHYIVILKLYPRLYLKFVADSVHREEVCNLKTFQIHCKIYLFQMGEKVNVDEELYNLVKNLNIRCGENLIENVVREENLQI